MKFKQHNGYYVVFVVFNIETEHQLNKKSTTIKAFCKKTKQKVLIVVLKLCNFCVNVILCKKILDFYVR